MTIPIRIPSFPYISRCLIWYRISRDETVTQPLLPLWGEDASFTQTMAAAMEMFQFMADQRVGKVTPTPLDFPAQTLRSLVWYRISRNETVTQPLLPLWGEDASFTQTMAAAMEMFQFMADQRVGKVTPTPLDFPEQTLRSLVWYRISRNETVTQPLLPLWGEDASFTQTMAAAMEMFQFMADQRVDKVTPTPLDFPAQTLRSLVWYRISRNETVTQPLLPLWGEDPSFTQTMAAAMEMFQFMADQRVGKVTPTPLDFPAQTLRSLVWYRISRNETVTQPLLPLWGEDASFTQTMAAAMEMFQFMADQRVGKVTPTPLDFPAQTLRSLVWYRISRNETVTQPLLPLWGEDASFTQTMAAAMEMFQFMADQRVGKVTPTPLDFPAQTLRSLVWYRISRNETVTQPLLPLWGEDASFTQTMAAAMEMFQFMADQRVGKVTPTPLDFPEQTLRQISCWSGYPEPPPLPQRENQWQLIHDPEQERELYLFNAYADRRSSPLFPTAQFIVQVLAMARRLIRGDVYCLLWDRKGGAPIVVAAFYREIWQRAWDPRNRFYTPWLISCPVPVGIDPDSVSLSWSSCPSVLTNRLAMLGPAKEAGLLDSKQKESLVVCVKGLDTAKDESRRLAEWVETTFLLGADTIAVYTYSVHPNTERLLQVRATQRKSP